MPDPLSTISTRRNLQSVQADPAQVKNSAGGYTFVVDDLTALRRFLATGADGGTYYAGSRDVALDANSTVSRLLESKPGEALDVLLDMSERGANVRQQPVMFVLARLVSCSDDATRKRALDALPRIARTGTHLFLFASYVEQFRGWGRGLRRAVGAWYTDGDVDRLAYQIAKYGSRHGFTHGDLLRLAHPLTSEPTRRNLFDHTLGREADGSLPEVTRTADRLRGAVSAADVVAVINETPNLSWEMVPSEHLGKPEVWQALLDGDHVPIGALIRNLGRLTANGVVDPYGEGARTEKMQRRLRDSEGLRKGRVHPMSVMLAGATYATGHGDKGSLSWSPVSAINRSLDDAFYAAFDTIEPVRDKTVMIGLDVSQSMSNNVAGLSLSCRDASVGLGLALSAKFPRNISATFTCDNEDQRRYWRNPDHITLTPIDLDRGRRITDVVRETSGMNFGGTDCSLPMRHALERGLAIDTFVVLTDNETWAGKMHPQEALRLYRERTGIKARMVTVAMQYNHATIADPSDPLMLDVVGLDMGVVNTVGDFVQGLI